jgi:diguanylate cyclase (GGDEF)-like protein
MFRTGSDAGALKMNDQAAADSWRDLACLAADFAFETDREGRFVFLEPEKVLGWVSADLLGRPADVLLPETGTADPFCAGAPMRRRRMHLQQANGASVAVMITVAPILDAGGLRCGVRGLVQDVSRQDTRDAASAADRRRGEALLRITEQMRKETLPARRIQAALEALMAALGADGVALAELLGRNTPALARHRAGGGGQDILQAALTSLDPILNEPGQGLSADARPVLACPTITRFGERVALAAWAAPHAAPWSEGDLQLVQYVAAIFGAALEHESIQREMARQLRNDPLTGLLNRRAFLDEAARRIDRLDREDLNGTLMLIDLDDFAPLGRLGPEAGDEALCLIARMLRAAVRPADLVARLGGGGFAAWMDGADELTGAERAEMLRSQAPTELAQLAAAPGLPLTISIGIACRRPGRGEELDSLMRRAGLALEDAKHGGWRVSHDEPG